VAGAEDGYVHRHLTNVPVRESTGLRTVATAARYALHEMDVAPWLTDERGAVVPGALGILADSVLGAAVMTTVPIERGMVTSHLHLELLQPLPPGITRLRAEGRQRWLRGRFGLGEGEITTEDGEAVARATIGALLLDGGAPGRPRGPDEGAAPTATDRDATPAPTDAGAGAAHPLLVGAPVHAALGTTVVDLDGRRALVEVTAGRFLANRRGGLHGGAGVLIGERILELVLRAALAGDRVMRPVELRAAFLRGIPADDGRIACQATIAHLGRRLAAARGELMDHEGRPAVLIDATYITD